MRMRHPHVKPDLFVEVEDSKVAAHVAAGWLPESPAVEGPSLEDAPTPARGDRTGTNRKGDKTNGE